MADAAGSCPDDFVLATGRGYSVRDFVQTAFDHAGLDWQKHVRFDERYLRPTEVDSLIGDATNQLNPEPNNPTLKPGGLSIGDSPHRCASAPNSVEMRIESERVLLRCRPLR